MCLSCAHVVFEPLSPSPHQVTALRHTVAARDDKIVELRRRASATTLMEVAVARDEAMEVRNST